METTRTEKLTALMNRIAKIDTTIKNDTMSACGDTFKSYSATDRAGDAAIIETAKADRTNRARNARINRVRTIAGR